jgi:hypothetical protein
MLAWPGVSLLLTGSLCAAAQVVWTPAGKAPTDYAPQLAYDPVNGGLLSFGPGPSIGQQNETWLFRSGAWRQLRPVASPSARAHHALATDLLRQRVVMFGGQDFAFSQETWEWDGSNWTRANPATIPPARSGPAMAYDRARGLVVMFGGYGAGSGALQDTWEWDGQDWRAHTPAVSPAARGGHEMVYDSTRGVTLLCGGLVSVPFADLWAWDGTVWRLLANQSVPARTGHAMAFDERRGVLVVHGGTGATSALDDLWEWDGTGWNQRSSGPSARHTHAMAYDPLLGATVLFAGNGPRGANSETWIWDGTQWTDLGTGSPPPVQFAAMARSSAAPGILLFGGFGGRGMQDGTWHWDGDRWHELVSTNTPRARYRLALAHDALRDRTVLFGGDAGQCVELGDTWEWGAAGWQQMSPATSPGSRVFHAMAGDARRGRIVLFGGTQRGTVLADTWEWDGTDWVARGFGPPGRFTHGMAYDSARGVVVVFGGRSSLGDLNDTWEWDGTTWRQPLPARAPSPRTQFAMGYDEFRSRTVVYGGMTFDGSSVFDETWEWDGVLWRQRANTSPPGARVAASLAYDESTRRSIVHGGYVRSGGIIASNTAMLTWALAAVLPADSAPYGSGCPGSAGVPLLTMHGHPWIGVRVQLDLTQLPATAPGSILLGSSDSMWLGVPLPADLGSIGMPGCWLRTGGETIVSLQASGGAATFRFDVPVLVELVGNRFFVQGLAVDAAANALGVVVSNGVAMTVGAR